MFTIFLVSPDSSRVTVHMDNVEMRHSGITHRLPWLILKIIQVSSLGEGVNCQNLKIDIHIHTNHYTGISANLVVDYEYQN